MSVTLRDARKTPLLVHGWLPASLQGGFNPGARSSLPDFTSRDPGHSLHFRTSQVAGAIFNIQLRYLHGLSHAGIPPGVSHPGELLGS